MGTTLFRSVSGTLFLIASMIFSQSAAIGQAEAYQEAQALERKGAYEDALKKYQAAVKTAEAKGDHKAAAMPWLGIASVRIRQGRLSQALEALLTARKIAESIRDKGMRKVTR